MRKGYAMTRVLFVDPGITTGCVLAEIYDQEIKVSPWQDKYSCYEFWKFLNRTAIDEIVCEDFEFRRGLIWAELFPVQLIGVINCYAESRMINVHLQKARLIHGRGAYFDSIDSVKQLGVYIPGKDYHHSMDAMRHFLQWYTFGSGYQYHLLDRPLKLQK